MLICFDKMYKCDGHTQTERHTDRHRIGRACNASCGNEIIFINRSLDKTSQNIIVIYDVINDITVLVVLDFNKCV